MADDVGDVKAEMLRFFEALTSGNVDGFIQHYIVGNTSFVPEGASSAESILWKSNGRAGKPQWRASGSSICSSGIWKWTSMDGHRRDHRLRGGDHHLTGGYDPTSPLAAFGGIDQAGGPVEGGPPPSIQLEDPSIAAPFINVILRKKR